MKRALRSGDESRRWGILFLASSLTALCLGLTPLSAGAHEHDESAPPAVFKQLNLEEWQVDSFNQVMEQAEQSRRAIEPSSMDEMRTSLDEIDTDMFESLQAVLTSDQILKLKTLLWENRIHGMAADGRPLPDFARTGGFASPGNPQLSITNEESGNE